jgi:hypothetical protein
MGRDIGDNHRFGHAEVLEQLVERSRFAAE